MNQDKELVYERLRTVLDPELNVDIVRLGLIYGVEVFPMASVVNQAKPDSTGQPVLPVFSKIVITMTLTTPGCPLAPVINQMVKDSLFDLVDDREDQIIIDLTFDPPWTPELMDEDTRLELGI